ncbi:hypothetical protein [Kosakonia sp. Marseille-Q7440]
MDNQSHDSSLHDMGLLVLTLPEIIKRVVSVPRIILFYATPENDHASTVRLAQPYADK